tara:strand:+ start:4918 stop:5139 length:222 start_codon:yes stop_codon:yes gene_type:complete
MKVSPKQFIEVWQRAKSLEEVAKRTGMLLSACSARASHYRLKGVNLKRFSRRPTTDWEKLAALADSLSEGGGE